MKTELQKFVFWLIGAGRIKKKAHDTIQIFTCDQRGESHTSEFHPDDRDVRQCVTLYNPFTKRNSVLHLDWINYFMTTYKKTGKLEIVPECICITYKNGLRSDYSFNNLVLWRYGNHRAHKSSIPPTTVKDIARQHIDEHVPVVQLQEEYDFPYFVAHGAATGINNSSVARKKNPLPYKPRLTNFQMKTIAKLEEKGVPMMKIVEASGACRNTVVRFINWYEDQKQTQLKKQLKAKRAF